MRVLFVEGRNAGPFRKPFRIEFSDETVIGIVGQYKGNRRRSNESGKSSFLQLIGYGLYGRLFLADSDLVHDWADGDMVVKVGVEIGEEDNLIITRGRRTNDRPIFEVEGHEGATQKDLQDHISRRIGVSCEDYMALCYFDQMNVHRFLGGKHGVYLDRWLPLHHWKALAKECASKSSTIQAKIDGFSARIDEYSGIVKELSKFKAVVTEAESAIEDERRKNELLEKRYRNLREAGNVKSSLSSLRSRLSTAIRGIHSCKGVIRSSIDLKKAFEKEMMDIKKGFCPTLKRPCKPLAKSQAKQVKLKLAGVIDRLNLSRKELRSLEAEREKVSVRIEDLESRTVDPNDVKRAKKEWEASKNLLMKRIATHGVALANLDAAKKSKQRRKDLLDKLEGEKVQASMWNRLVVAINKTRFLQLDNALVEVEERCNSILDSMDVSGRIRFSTSRELSSQWDPICGECGETDFVKGKCSSCQSPRQRKRKDELRVEIVHADKVRKFGRESMGAQFLLSFGVRMACMAMLSESLGVPLDLLLLDEPLGNLDEVNRERLLSIVVNRLRTDFGVRQCFVISHVGEVRDIADRTLVVTRYRNHSKVRWEK